MLFDNIFFKGESNREWPNREEWRKVCTLYKGNRIEINKSCKFLCANGGWGLLSSWGLVKCGLFFFPTETVEIDIQREFPNSIYSQLSQSCWPLRVKLAQLALTTGLINSNGIMALCFRGCFEISWERKMADKNGSEQERKDVFLGIVQRVFLFCGFQLNQ